MPRSRSGICSSWCLFLLICSAALKCAYVDASTVGDDCSGGAATCNTAGQYCLTAGASSTCQLVSVGSYSDGSGVEISCGTGYTTAATGSSGSSAQLACTCDLGYGRSSSDNSVSCTPCAVGTFKAAADDAACGTVAAGYYASVDGTTYATNTATASVPCAAGTFKAGGGGACATVAVGYFSSMDGSTYAFSAADREVACLSGTYKASEGAGACATASAGSCAADSAGTCTNTAGKHQVGCAAGTWSNAGSATCASCGGGYTTDAAGAGAGGSAQVACVCVAGYGRVNNSVVCTKCSAGTFKGSTGDAACVSNSAGTFTANTSGSQVNVQATQEIACPGGYWSAGASAACAQALIGYYAADSAGNGVALGAPQAVACPAGRFSSGAGSTSCSTSAAGSCAANAGDNCVSSAGVKSVLCPAGKFSDIGAISCTDCDAGYTTGTAGDGTGSSAQTACICSSAHGRHSNSLPCVACVGGYHKASTGDSLCTPCAVGEFYDTDGSVYDGSTNQCETCGTGYTSVLGSADVFAQYACLCDIGYGRPTGSNGSACEKCTSGFYKIDVGDMECEEAAEYVAKDTSGLNHVSTTEYWWFDKIQPSWASTNEVIATVRWAFLSGLAVLVLLLVFEELSGRAAFGGPIAAHKSVWFSRFLIVLHFLCNAILLHWSVYYDNMVARTSWPRILVGTKYEMSWLHHMPRAVTSLFFVGAGVGAAYHSFPALLCVLACFLDLISSIISAVELRDYINQSLSNGAPLGGDWTKDTIMWYYYRDITSIALSSAVLFSVLHVMILLGYMGSPLRHLPGNGGAAWEDGRDRLLTYDKVAGGHLDRAARLREQRDKQLMKRVLTGKRTSNRGAFEAVEEDERNVYYGEASDDDDEEGTAAGACAKETAGKAKTE